MTNETLPTPALIGLACLIVDTWAWYLFLRITTWWRSHFFWTQLVSWRLCEGAELRASPVCCCHKGCCTCTHGSVEMCNSSSTELLFSPEFKTAVTPESVSPPSPSGFLKGAAAVWRYEAKRESSIWPVLKDLKGWFCDLNWTSATEKYHKMIWCLFFGLFFFCSTCLNTSLVY